MRGTRTDTRTVLRRHTATTSTPRSPSSAAIPLLQIRVARLHLLDDLRKRLSCALQREGHQVSFEGVLIDQAPTSSACLSDDKHPV